jgi:signal transduction histidine kinase
MLVEALLLVVAARLLYAQRRRRDVLEAEMRDTKQHLEQEVGSRTRELVELTTHLQDLAEREKASLARELHDELGGLLVGARMDISWAEQHLARNDPDLKLRLNRVQQNLAASIDLKRRIIEELRPTLLDNVGLIAALRWQLKATCAKAGLACTESYPAEEPHFVPEAAIALFRIAQGALNNILEHARAHHVSLALSIDEAHLSMRIVDDGGGIPAGSSQALDSHGLASMRHRARALGGWVDIGGSEGGGTAVTVQIPVANALVPMAAQS